MPTMRRAAVALGMLALVAGCARSTGSEPISAPASIPASIPASFPVSVKPSDPITAAPPTISAAPSQPSPSAGGGGSATPPPAKTAAGTPTPLPELQLVGNRSVGWTLAKPGARDTDVLVQVEVPACQHVLGDNVVISGKTATIAVLASVPPPGICPDYIRVDTVLVRAPQSLTGLTLAHARLGK